MAGDDILSAPYVLEYTYTRSTGPVIGRFLTALRDGRVEGAKTASGRVLVPALEHDPDTGEATDGFAPVADRGVVTTWAWVAEPRPTHPVDQPFAFALIRLDGADTALAHAVVAPRETMATGMRVRARWAAERSGAITDIECFVPEEGAS